MKTFRTRREPLRQRPYYELADIENICAEELRKVGLYPSKPEPIRIERFIEKRFGIHPTYQELPKGVLGFTRFGQRGVEEIVVSGSLAEEGRASSERRINTTLAHEAGHALLHAHLFASGYESRSLLDGLDLTTPKILCRADAVPGANKVAARSSYDGRWWEFQANRAIGGLLLPRPLVEACLAGVCSERGTFGRRVLEPHQRKDAVARVAEAFDVNPIVARIRLDELYPPSDHDQLTL